MDGDDTLAAVAGMAAGIVSGFDNPMADDGGEKSFEDTDVVVVEDTFERARSLLCDDDGNLRLALRRLNSVQRWLTCFQVFIFPVLAFALNTVGGSDALLYEDLDGDGKTHLNHGRLLDLIYGMGLMLFLGATSVYPAELVRTIHAENGALKKLGMGSKRVAASEAEKLLRWPRFLKLVAVPIICYGIFAGFLFLMIFFM